MVDEARFLNLWSRCGGQNGRDVWAAVDDGYSEDHRAYHGWIHISALLKALEAVRSEPEFADVDFDNLELAIFFHDVVYEPRFSDNEAQSARLFESAAAGMPPERVKHVSDMILATARHEAGDDPSTRLLLDLDLGILGASLTEYQRYAAAIRAEYEHVPPREWLVGRSKVIEKFLARPVIYQTDYFRSRLEESARERVSEELQSLQR